MQRLLVLETRMLGDAILSLPFIRGAAERYNVTVCCLPESVSIFRAVLPAENVIACHAPWMSDRPAREKWSDWVRVTRLLREKNFAVAVTVWPDVRLHAWMTLLGIPRRVGFPMNQLNFYGWQRPWRGRQLTIGRVLNVIGSLALLRPLLNDTLSKENHHQRHWMDWRQLSEALQTPWRNDLPWFPVDTTAISPVVSGFIRQERAAGRPVWMVHPGARFANRRWPLEKFQALLDDVFPARGVSVVVVRPPDSPALCVRHAHQLDYAAANLTELTAAVAAVDGLLGNDSMMVHLAAALGRRVVTIFGPGGIGWFTPYQNDAYTAYINNCPHRPCLDHCLMPSPICLEQLDVTVVQQKLDLALDFPTTQSC